MPAIFFVYIIHSKIKDRFYIGSTGDYLTERIRRHNTNHRGFTGNVNDWELVYQEAFPDKATALQREKEIKAWKSSIKIKKLITNSRSDA